MTAIANGLSLDLDGTSLCLRGHALRRRHHRPTGGLDLLPQSGAHVREGGKTSVGGGMMKCGIKSGQELMGDIIEFPERFAHGALLRQHMMLLKPLNER